MRRPTGRELDEAVAAETSWILRRNCSLTPRQLIGFYASLCAVSLAIAAVFWWHGATFVLAFAGVELMALGLALLAFCRHAGDRETITLDGGRVRIEHRCGSRVERQEFRAAWVRVDCAGSLVRVSESGQHVAVGRYVRADQRQSFAQDLRRALGTARVGAVAGLPGEQER
jgi:uncharacterized membrane protein